MSFESSKIMLDVFFFLLYGDSRITAPKPSAEMDFVRVKGGENAVLLKATLDIETLRDFQCKEYSPSDERFKPKPAGYDCSKARTRVR